MTATKDKNLRIAITGSLVVHALLFAVLVWMSAGDAAHKLWQQAAAPPKEKEVTFLFPDQIIPEPPPIVPAVPVPPPAPPPPPPKKEVYIRTSQNDTATAAPKNAPFISDRNTTAATVKAAAPDATEPLPSMDGLKIPSQDMADRDYKDGELKDDARAKSPPPKLAMVPPQPATPPTAPPDPVLKPKEPPPPPAQTAPPSPPPPSVAKVAPESTPLTRMMEEADKELARVDKNRLSIELKKAEPATEATPSAKTTAPEVPPMREVTDMRSPAPDQSPPAPAPEPKVPNAVPVAGAEGISRTTKNTAPDAFVPFTRTQQTKGTISNHGTQAAVDAEESPKGRYIRQVTGQVEKKWHLYRHLRRDGVTFGSLEISFYVNKKGKVEGLRIINDKESNPVLTGFTLQAIKDADIPPIPADVLPSLPMNDQERLKVDYNVLIY